VLGATETVRRDCAQRKPGPLSSISAPASAESYTPQHLAEKILTSKSALEGEPKQVTVLLDLPDRSLKHRRPSRKSIAVGEWAP